MKTLREILLEKHRSADHKLDVVRKRVLAELDSGVAISRDPKESTPWLAWLLSMRWHLAALSAAWVLVGWLNADKQAAGQNADFMADNSSPQYVLLALKENRRQLHELIEPPTPQAVAQPRRRSELQPSTEMA